MLFHTRLEWDDHKLSSDHLRKVGEQRRLFNPDLKDDEFELLDVIVIEDDIEEIPVDTKVKMMDDQEIKEEEEEEEEAVDSAAAAATTTTAAIATTDTTTIVEKESEDNKEIKVEADIEVEKEKETEEKKESDNAKEDDPAAIKKEKDEKYNPANVVGRELVVKTAGFVCRLCAVFMKNDEEAELHCQTATHYINYITITKLHVSI